MSLRIAGLISAVLVLASCNAQDRAAPEPQPSSTHDGIAFEFGRALIDTEQGSVIVRVEIAENEDQHRRGLAQRSSLPDDSGMFFVFFAEGRESLATEGPLIPLSTAFIDRDGEIVSIQDGERCASDRCETDPPGAAYSAALQVPRGSFERWGVDGGDLVTLTH